MGLTLAFPAAAAQDAPREEASGSVHPIAPSDGELIQRIGAGDAGAFELLYRRYSRPVFGLALRRLGDRMAAEEAVQETFASLWRSARTYKPEPAVYQLAVTVSGRPPERLLMVAAHAWDLRGAQGLGLRTAYVARPVGDPPASSDRFDLHADGLADLAARLGKA